MGAFGVEQKRFMFGRSFVKRFALCYRSVACLSVLSVTLVYYGQTVGWIKMKLGMEVGLGPGHIVLDGDPARQFSAHVYCDQTVAHLTYCRILCPGWVDCELLFRRSTNLHLTLVTLTLTFGIVGQYR